MLPLVSVPDFVHRYARRYRDLFSPSLLDHFERYLSGLYVCDRRNAQMINDAFVGDKDQSSLNRFLTEYEWSTEQVNERRLKLLRDDGQTRPRRSGVLPIDETFNEKFGKHFERIGKFFLPSEEHYTWAHNLVMLHWLFSNTGTKCDMGLCVTFCNRNDFRLIEAPNFPTVFVAKFGV
jgi:hypothetical protein